MSANGKIYFIPVPLGNNDPKEVLPQSVFDTVEKLDEYIVENEKTARRFIKKICPSKDQSALKFHVLDKRTEAIEYSGFLSTVKEGKDIGLMSEAGTPGIADPGADIAHIAHEKGIQVVPLVGPSSILMAMLASGMNGQSFAFNGYLPIDKHDRKKAIKEYERRSLNSDQAQIFIETPYRNKNLFEDLKSGLNPNTDLCIAVDITLSTEFIKTKKVKTWNIKMLDFHKKP
ncbi:MAG: SAM-dependent methyltransferase, partial [Bacteroidota bacterium]